MFITSPTRRFNINLRNPFRGSSICFQSFSTKLVFINHAQNGISFNIRILLIPLSIFDRIALLVFILYCIFWQNRILFLIRGICSKRSICHHWLCFFKRKILWVFLFELPLVIICHSSTRLESRVSKIWNNHFFKNSQVDQSTLQRAGTLNAKNKVSRQRPANTIDWAAVL